MIAEIDRAREAGDTMGGSFEVIAHNVPPAWAATSNGIASSMADWGRRSCRFPPSRLSASAAPGRRDPSRIAHPRRNSAARWDAEDCGCHAANNNAGGLEGGVTNGEDLRITGYINRSRR